MRPQLLPLLLLVACGGKTDTAGEDLDGDGYGVAVDCDDEDEDVNPGATEQPYDGVDNDCDESTRDDDLDEDGYVESQDCDDGDPDAYPGGPEYCDGADNDCDGVVDEQALDTLSWYRDGDSDGYGDAEQGALECDRPSGYVADATDCDDSDPEVHPGAEEVWDGVDNDCDGDVDEEGGAPEFDWFHDADGDSYGDPFDAVKAAEQPSGFVANDNDCDDANPDIHPGATELCNDTDDDCDMTTDEDGACDELDVAGADDWWTGDASGDEAGLALAGGHDLTGDGTDDFLIGAPGSSYGGQFYFMPGEYLGYTTGLDLHRGSSSGAITWDPPIPGSDLGSDVVLFPDVDGDGEVDFGVGSPGTDGDAAGSGIAVLWFSAEDGYTMVSSNGTGAEMGVVASAGDADLDGLSDVLVGAPGMSSGAIGGGFAELFLGDASSQLSVGAYWVGDGAGDQLGSELSSAGDVDGDGYSDLLLAAQGFPSGDATGAVWLVMGGSSWPGSEARLLDADHQFLGSATGDHAGYALSGGQDFDDDGYDDFVVGAPYNSASGTASGAVYLWTGGASWGRTSGSYSLASAPVSFRGEASSDRAGWSLQLMADATGDGRDDLAVGAPYHSGSGANRGKVYLLWGGPGFWVGSCDLADAHASWLGVDPGDNLGWALAAGDADADGLSDLMMSAPSDDENGTSSGTVYLVLGW
jgi:hypothetical protein